MPLSADTSAAIVTGIHQGDKDAETLLCRTYGPQLLFILTRRCGDPDLAQDICQETLVVLLEKFRKQMIDDPGNLTAYVHKTAINILIASKRKEARRQTTFDSDIIETFADLCNGPLSELEIDHIRKAVRQGIEDLRNERDRQVLRRLYILEQDKDEICKELNIGFRHFDKVIDRARARLRKILDRPENEGLRLKPSSG